MMIQAFGYECIVRKIQDMPPTDPAPSIPNKRETSEKELYEGLWSSESYRKRSPGLDYVEQFLSECNIGKNDTIVDVGCGTGRVSQYLWDKGQYVEAVDIAENCLDTSIDPMIPFYCLDISEETTVHSYDWIFCSDMMEHLPTEQVPAVLKNLLHMMNKGAFFVIPMFEAEDHGETLHKTIADLGWWAERFKDAGWYKSHHVTITPTGDNRRLIIRVERRSV